MVIYRGDEEFGLLDLSLMTEIETTSARSSQARHVTAPDPVDIRAVLIGLAKKHGSKATLRPEYNERRPDPSHATAPL